MRSAAYFIKMLYLCIFKFTKRPYRACKRINKKYNMYLDLKDSGISKTLYLYGTREKDQVYIASSMIKKGMKVLDIGANIGYYCLLEADIVGDSGKVYAFEPHWGNFELLKENIRLNDFSKRVELHQKGISNRNGRQKFYISHKSNLHTLNPDRFDSGGENSRFDYSREIDFIDIKDFLIEKNDIDFIRMDIEGHEVEVLGRLEEALGFLQNAPSVLLETHFPRYDEKTHNMKKALSGLMNMGYEMEIIVSIDESTSPFKNKGYIPERVIKTDMKKRGIYYGIKKEDALHAISDTGGIRAIFLRKIK